MNVKVINTSSETITIAGLELAAGENTVDSETLALLARLGLLGPVRQPALQYDLSALEAP